MGDRYFRRANANVEALLRRPPGIGHNGGPPLDMSWSGWLWRRETARVWATPPREVALRRLRNAERLGVSYRDYAAALMHTGRTLSTALLPLHYAVDAALAPDPAYAGKAARFGGKLLILIDPRAWGRLDDNALKRLAAASAALVGDAAAAPLVLASAPFESDRTRGARLRALLTARGVHAHEVFLLGGTADDAALAESANLGCFLPILAWFVEFADRA
ncbi:MAG: hypothetical protein KIT16_19220 [Rhodospirillaceae bacterium]|nr:hypothetical protein [Rhodospirillaceae bacterium]